MKKTDFEDISTTMQAQHKRLQGLEENTQQLQKTRRAAAAAAAKAGVPPQDLRRDRGGAGTPRSQPLHSWRCKQDYKLQDMEQRLESMLTATTCTMHVAAVPRQAQSVGSLPQQGGLLQEALATRGTYAVPSYDAGRQVRLLEFTPLRAWQARGCRLVGLDVVGNATDAECATRRQHAARYRDVG